jgi:chaperonin GroEL
MSKKVFYDQEAREKILAGAKSLYDAVKVTFGPKGRNVVIEKSYGAPIITHDGVTVAENLELGSNEDNLGEEVGAKLIRQAATKLNKVAGDGTTTVTVLTYHILNEANKLIAAGYNPMELRKGIEAEGTETIKQITKLAEKIDGQSEKIEQIATISAASPEIGKLIADVISKIGKDGIVTVEAGQSLEMEKEIVEGYSYDKGFSSPFFVTDSVRQEAISNKPAILITDQKISAASQILPLLEKMATSGKKDLVIIADEVEGEALSILVLNKLKGVFNSLVVKAPSFGDRRKEILEDLAILTGATVISPEKGLELEEIDLNSLGSAKKVIATKSETTIIEGAGQPVSLKTRLAEIKENIKSSIITHEKDQLKNRLAALEGKVAVIKVGGLSETEIDEKKFRVDDAVAATKAALEEGIVPGGGSTLVYLANKLKGTDPTTKIVQNALKAPLIHILENAGLNSQALLSEIEKTNKPGLGINVMKPEQGIIDLKNAGIIDPAKVTKEAVKNAVSIAATAITMGALIVDIPEKEAPAMPQMPGMY